MFKPTEIIDNFLELPTFTILQNVFLSADIPWYYNKGINKPLNSDDLNDYQFTHKIYENNRAYSETFELMQPILEALKVRALIRIKANLSPKTETHQLYGLHKDTDFECTTAIMYLNTTNGHTVFENDEKVDGVENRLIKFDSQLKHSGVSSTDTQVRVVLNFNYF
jgi:hypothetical protein